MRLRLSNQDWAIALGAGLLILSALGWYINMPHPEQDPPAALAVHNVPTLPLEQPAPLQATPTAVAQGSDDSSSFLVPVSGGQPAQPSDPTAEQPTAAPAQAIADPLPNITSTATTPTAQAVLRVPDRIEIPAVHLDAPIFPSAYTLVQLDGLTFQQWQAPNSYAAGWQTSSAGLGSAGNTVLLGHNNINGEVFAHLVDLNEGDSIQVQAGDIVIRYRVTKKMILLEKGQDLSVRLQNASWLLPTKDERLTLVTCWPQTSNTHRLIIVAIPETK